MPTNDIDLNELRADADDWLDLFKTEQLVYSPTIVLKLLDIIDEFKAQATAAQERVVVMKTALKREREGPDPEFLCPHHGEYADLCPDQRCIDDFWAKEAKVRVG